MIFSSSLQAASSNLILNGSFDSEVNVADFRHLTQNGNVERSSKCGFKGYGAEISYSVQDRKPNLKEKVKGRAELAIRSSKPMVIGESRWFAFTFKMVNSSFLAKNSGITIQQFLSTQGFGPKLQFYIAKNSTGGLAINLLHTLRCDYPYADKFINADSELLCADAVVENHQEKKIRRSRFSKHEIEEDTWYHVKLMMTADAPISKKFKNTNAIESHGVIRAFIKRSDSEWEVFKYKGANALENQLLTYTHETTPSRRFLHQNKFKIGLYGKGLPNKQGLICFDELHSVTHHTQLPSLYK